MSVTDSRIGLLFLVFRKPGKDIRPGDIRFHSSNSTDYQAV